MPKKPSKPIAKSAPVPANESTAYLNAFVAIGAPPWVLLVALFIGKACEVTRTFALPICIALGGGGVAWTVKTGWENLHTKQGGSQNVAQAAPLAALPNPKKAP